MSHTWRWKTKRQQRYETADYKAMTSQSWQDFDRDLRIRLQDYEQTRVFQHGHNGHGRNCAFLNAATDEELPTNKTKKSLELEQEKMASCLKETIEAVVPKKKNKKKNGREMSKETLELHE